MIHPVRHNRRWRALLAAARVAGLLLVCLLIVIPAPAGAAGEAVIEGQATVIDGDTIEIHGQRIRLHGIDAPEARQTCERNGQPYRCGQQAAMVLADMIGRRTVLCEAPGGETLGRDRYGRVIGRCRAGGRDLGEALVAAGWAVAYRRYSRDYVPAEKEAQRLGAGIWAGRFEMPAEFRKR